MNCENEFCIYQEKGKCILNEVSLDILGQCTECIYVNLDEKVLSEAKEKLREKNRD